MTYFTINEKDGPIPIPPGKGFGASNFCSGAGLENFDESLTYEIYQASISKKPHENQAFEKEKEDEKTEKMTMIQDIQPEPKLPIWKRAFFFICGIETLRNQKADEPEVEPDVSIDTHPFWSNIINLVAVFVAAVGGFFIAFFNKY